MISVHILLMISVQFLHLISEVENGSGFLKCPGNCWDPKHCRDMGGKILGYCLNDKACCDRGGGDEGWVGSCGDKVTSQSKTSHFRSPNYPNPSSGDLLCQFQLQLSQSTFGIRLDFLDLKMDTLPVDPTEYAQTPYSLCDSDMMFIKGFKNWSPDPRCGNLSRYSILVEREEDQQLISIVFLMSSSEYKWNIRLTQIYNTEVSRLHEIIYNPTPSSINPNNVVLNLNGPQFPGQFFPYPPPPPSPPLIIGPPLPYKFPEPGEWNLTSQEEEERYRPIVRIAGGENAEPNGIPWQVSIQSVQQAESNLCGEIRNMSVHLCGGSIIDERTIITAAHCFYSSSRYPHTPMEVKDLKVVLGELNMCQSDEVQFRKEYSISAIILHFNYISTEILNDIAIIHLSQSIQFNQGVQPIPLASQDMNYEEVIPLLSGWGSFGVSENSTYPASLQKTSNLVLLSQAECGERQRAYMNFNVEEGRLVGKYLGLWSKGICGRGKSADVEAGFGDSGGPLVALTNSQMNKMGRSELGPILIGVVSHMRPELESIHNSTFNLDYFLKVADYKKWILMATIPH